MIESRNGNVYAYRSVRRNGKPRRVYLGAGESGRILHAVYRNRTLNRNHRTSLERAQQAVQASKFDRANKTATEAIKAVNDLVALVLERAGYHRPGRHSWRRKRGAIMGSIAEELASMTAAQAAAEGKLAEWVKDREERAINGDMVADRELWGDSPGDDEFFDDDMPPPEPTRKKRYASSLPAAARVNLLTIAAKCDETYDKILEEVRQVEADLAGPNPSAIVKLLASAAAAAYLDHWITDSHGKRNIERPDEALERYRSRANRRYLSTLRELATVRRLESTQPTSIRIANTGPQQINVGQPSGKAIGASD